MTKSYYRVRRRRHPFTRNPRIRYECGNERSVYNGAPDRCPQCNAPVVTSDE